MLGLRQASHHLEDDYALEDDLVDNQGALSMRVSKPNEENGAHIHQGEGDDQEETKCCTSEQCSVNEVAYQTVLLFLINVFLFADQNLMAPNLTAIANDLGLGTPEQRDVYLGGYVSLGFFCVGALTSIVAGYLADSTHRILTLAAVVLVGQSACLGTFFVQTYSAFLAMRILTGFAVGGNVPILYSLLGDMYTTSTRGRISSLAAIAMGFGVGMGQILAGLLGPVLGWRAPFLIVAVPALALTVLLVATTAEPRRGEKEQVFAQIVTEHQDFEYHEEITAAKFVSLCRSPSVSLLLASCLPGSLPWGVVIVYFNDYVAQEMQIPVQQSTLLVLVFGVGIVLGTLLGGVLTDRWLRERTNLLVGLTATCFVVGAVPLIAILYCTQLALWAYVLLCLPAGVVAGVPGGVVRGLLINVTLPELRGSAFAIMNLVDDLGRGLGPFLVSLIILALPGDRATALAISFGAWLVSALLFVPLLCTYRRDLDLVESTMIRNHLRRNPHHSHFFQSDHRLLDPLELDAVELELT